MPELKPHQIETVDRIENIRKKNNTLWMDILRIALKAEPELTKSILRDININDQKISRNLEHLANV